ncbi:MAG: hypothetical protein ACFBSE_00710, partial [Prochloraceae cyanobacterium]
RPSNRYKPFTASNKGCLIMDFVRKEVDEIEFFVERQTDLSGLSVSGLARLSGVSQQGISKLLDSLTTRAASKWLKSLIGKELTLTTNYSSSDSKARNTTIIKSSVCALIVTHYAFAGRETAQLALIKFNVIGIDRWIKEVVGYKDKGDRGVPKQLQASIECRQIYENLEHFNPRVAQLLVDSRVNEVISPRQPENPERLLGVMEIAAEMGYRIPSNYRSSLGRYVAHRCASFAKEEQRLVNGLLRPCKLYPLNNAFVRGAITEYLRLKELAN